MFCLHVNKEATFLPQVHMPPSPPPEFYLWTLGDSAGPHLKTPCLGEHRTRGAGPGPWTTSRTRVHSPAHGA